MKKEKEKIKNSNYNKDSNKFKIKKREIYKMENRIHNSKIYKKYNNNKNKDRNNSKKKSKNRNKSKKQTVQIITTMYRQKTDIYKKIFDTETDEQDYG